ncbi:MAG: pre-peptidase C-terminal domain-containing protein [Nitratireductor sp.]|nr:pre-peptidase C-terminal domain-containing protein [Nitratireductor sp.]
MGTNSILDIERFRSSVSASGQSVVSDPSISILSGAPQTTQSITASSVNPVDGILFGVRWAGPLTYSFADALADFGNSYPYAVTGFAQVSATQQQAIASILEGTGTAFSYGSFEQVSLIDISLASDPNGVSDITIGQANFFDGANLDTARVADFPGEGSGGSDGDLWFGDDGNQYRNPLLGDYAWMTHIHELGHAFGLSHAHNGGGSAFDVTVPVEYDSMEYTVMSYRSHVLGNSVTGYGNETYGFAQTLMILDILALQYLYGANYNTNNSDTVYTWNPATGEMSLNGTGQGAPGTGAGGTSNRIFMTVWDGGGIDTYDLSNYATNLELDLRDGRQSTFSAAQLADLGDNVFASGNVYNASMYGSNTASLIENAFGGSGSDHITGNQASNQLQGNGGSDVLDGREGSDIIRGGNGVDYLFGDFDTNNRGSNPGSTYSGDMAAAKTVADFNNSLGSAISVTSDIGYGYNQNVFYSDEQAHVSISAQGNDQRDWYSFTILTSGTVILDIDGSTNLLDTRLNLYNSSGTLLAANDDGLENIVGGFSNDPQNPESFIFDEGSSTYTDSILLYFGLAAGTYYVEVFQWDEFVTNGVNINTGQDYVLNITVPVDETFLFDDPATNDADFLFGDAGNDFLFGQGGADWLYGGDDNDTMYGGAGSDLMFGDSGTDTMYGGDDIDYMWGGTGGDTMHGNDGADWLRGEGGVDFLYGEAGNDVLIGGDGNDQMWGGSDTDTFYGEANNDIIYGEANGDVAFGQDGNDSIFGGSEGDFLFGGIGTDTINGGTENDLMWGNMPGLLDGVRDTFVFDPGWGFDAIYDFELGIDRVRFEGVAGLTQFSNLVLFDGGANVTVVFGSDAITLYGVTQAELESNQGDFVFV